MCVSIKTKAEMSLSEVCVWGGESDKMRDILNENLFMKSITRYDECIDESMRIQI